MIILSRNMRRPPDTPQSSHLESILDGASDIAIRVLCRAVDKVAWYCLIQ